MIAISTTGQGELPPNSQKFWKAIRSTRLRPGCLQQMRFASFGLGDTSYPKYNWAHRKLYNRLVALGAQPICDRGESDEQHPEGYVNIIDAPFHPAFFCGFLCHLDLSSLYPQPNFIPTTSTCLTIRKHRRLLPTMVNKTPPTSPRLISARWWYRADTGQCSARPEMAARDYRRWCSIFTKTRICTCVERRRA